eukprot:CAMPEP_0194251788 /NCGR_PEP_ID=MMETSP0158-20130606/26194_1 /TAXON_ID=33649 /ORGANISM="Thalassionema nitzschioides, Strain L26-B" /LENGTH=548 /DNA_ID=CAMNT_0038989023 /DNA_START=58 /DNA_END=1704 /DNA_ORIENTATION=+
MSTKPEDRLLNFKKGIDAEDGRRRREETQLSLRKQKKDERLSKRRLANTAPATSQGAVENAASKGLPNLNEFVKSIQDTSKSSEHLIGGVRGIRRLLSVSKNPPFKEVIDIGALKPLVECLMRTDNPELQFEAAWALTNVASSSYTSAVADFPNAIDYLSKLLRSENADVREQCAWCLGNIAGDCPQYRDAVISHGALESLRMNLNEPANESLLANVVWAVSNLCRGKPKPNLADVSPILRELCMIVANRDKLGAETVTDALWALSYVSDGDDNHIDCVLAAGGGNLPRDLVEILREGVSGDVQLVPPALRILGNFASGTTSQTQMVVDAGTLGVAADVLDMSKKNIRKEMCWLLSNVAAGTQSQINSLIKTKFLVEKLVEISMDSEWQTRKESIWAISNLCTGGNDAHVSAVVENNGIEAFALTLEMTGEGRMILVALEALKSIFTVSERQNFSYLNLFDEVGGIDKLEELQTHNDNTVYQKAIEMIDEFFGEDDAEDENLAPKCDENGFTFGMESPPPAKNLFSGADSMAFSPSMFGESNHNKFNF